MKFRKSQKIRFDSHSGAYSIVTPRENYDSQITATDVEAELLISFFGKETIQIGNVKSNPTKAKKTFKLFPSGKEICLNLVFPKPAKPELRLYLSVRAGYKPMPNDIWFIFEKDKNLWIGSLDEHSWRNQNKILVCDESEYEYQEAIQELDEIKVRKLNARDVFIRDRKIALERMNTSNYLCEFDKSHHLFLSRFTGKPYLEAHHLIPMSLQKEVNQPLDIIDNIYCLCPYCHRAIHHSEKNLTRNIIETLVDKRPSVLNILDNDVTDIFNYYAVEDIA